MKLSGNVKNTIYVLSLIAFLLSVYLTYSHYVPTENKLCDLIGGDCDIATGSMYSTVDGILNEWGIYVNLPIPVALLGAIGFLFIPYMVWNIKKKYYSDILFYSTLVFVVFCAYLTYAEFFILDTICIYCDITKIILLVIFLILLWKKFFK